MFQPDSRTFRRRWLLSLVGMMVFAVLGSYLFRPLPNSSSPNSDTAATVADNTQAQYELNTGSRWQTSDVTSMYMGEWFTAPLTYTITDEGLALFEGDIALNLNSVTGAGMGVNRRNLLWTDGIVPYEIAPNLPAQNRVFDAIAHWETHTAIRFVQRTADNASQYPNYVYFQPSTGCWSYVGMQGGKQPLGLALGCSTGSTIHEIGHAVGLWHEHTRHDRDQFVTVYFDNIVGGMEHNFAKQITQGQDIGAYDYESIMHYPRWAFSKNGKDTIIPVQDVSIGQRDVLSAGDIAAVRFLYGK